MSGTLEELLPRLQKNKVKITDQRKAILKALLKVSCPATIEEIHRVPVCKKICNLATVYRTLKLFQKKGIVSSTQFGDGFARFELQLDNHHHHHHVVCRQCKKVEALDACVPPKMLKEVAAMGYVNLSHNLEFFGTCQNCRAT